MRRISKTIIAVSLIIVTLLMIASCDPGDTSDITSDFSIQLNDVGQGDATLVSCDTGGKSDSISGFSIQFIDVGQGDAALVSCDGHYMLIDGGPKGAADKVYNVLVEKKVTRLDYLIISHMHEDHIGGLQKALTYGGRSDALCGSRW